MHYEVTCYECDYCGDTEYVDVEPSGWRLGVRLRDEENMDMDLCAVCSAHLAEDILDDEEEGN
jgi:hypothetical protein